MTGTTKRHACSDCGSSDGIRIFDDGNGYCHACIAKGLKPFKKNGNAMNGTVTYTSVSQQPSVSDIDSYPVYDLPSRKISKEVCEFFKVKAHAWNNEPAHFYPYGDSSYKVRILPKDFRIVGKSDMLFGQREFPEGSKMLVITEGEIDALSVAQASMDIDKKVWPVVSIPSASQTNVLLAQREWLKSFGTVVLWFDSDEAGQKAVDVAAKIIGFDKVKVVDSKAKDANALYLEGGAKAVNAAVWAARQYSPAGVIMGEKIWDQFQERQATESIPYPECLDGLNQKLKGVRYGEITLFTSGTGSGKSTVIKEIILDLLGKTDDKVGLISLEESVGDTAEKFIGMSIQRNLTDGPIPATDLRRGFEDVFGDERLILLDHQGSVGDSSLIDKIEHMCLLGCKYLVLDHITIAVSEGSEGLAGNEAVDKVMSDLLKIVKRHNVWLGLVSHLRKSGGKAFEEGNQASIDDIKGSGSIKQIAFDVVAFSRNLTAERDADRNKIQFVVLKSRFTGLTGPAGAAIYNPETGRLVNYRLNFEV